MDWMTIVQNVGTFGVGSGILAILVKSLVTNFLSKGLAAYQSKLDATLETHKSIMAQDIEAFKSKLQLATIEHQVRFSKLHDKQANIIANFYGQIFDLYKAADFVRLFPGMDDSEKDAKCKLFLDTFDGCRDFFGKHRIYFDRNCCSKIVSFLDKVLAASGTLASFVEFRGTLKSLHDQEYEEWNKAMLIMEQDIPVVKTALEESLQQILGVAQTSNRSVT